MSEALAKAGISPIQTLIDRQETADSPALPPGLRAIYGGDLRFPPPGAQRPYVIGNFVSTVDGVVSYQIPGKSGGGDISGMNESDRFTMGLLRASADAVMVGSSTLGQTAPEHLFIAEGVYPEGREMYSPYRSQVLKKAAPPLQVVVTGRGDIDLTRAIFRTPGIRTLIVTTVTGKAVLDAKGVSSLAGTEVRTFEREPIQPAAILEVLRDEFGVQLLLHEGGPTLFGEFVAAGCVDELFLTVAPRVAGRGEHSRPAFVQGAEFLPETAPQLEIVTVKERGSFLFMRYRACPQK